MKNLFLILFTFSQIMTCWGCSKKSEPVHEAPQFKSSIPANNASEVSLDTEIQIVFDEVITLSNNHGITINNTSAQVEASLIKLQFEASLESDAEYRIKVPAGAVINTFGVALEEAFEIVFTTKQEYQPGNDDLQFVANMGVGWNLGNTLDTKHEDETYWGNPLATKELIDAVKAKGFNTLRVPVTWQYHMGDAPDYTIDSEWLNRVDEVINYGLDNDMYVIVNIHHDEEWLIPTYVEVDRAKEQLGKVWSQIAEKLKAYESHLIFETLNETRLKGSAEEWTGGTAEGRDCINQFHEAAVEAIRATGGNNADRYIMVSTYAASSAQVAIDGLVLPNTDNLIVSVHNYYPYRFALAEDDYVTTWGTDAEKQAMDAEFDRLVDKFVSKGIPVVMGEWGSLDHDNLEHRVVHAAYYASGCIERGICPIWWDNGISSHFGIINRHNYTWFYPEIADALVNSLP